MDPCSLGALKLVTGATGILIPKLVQLLRDEYKLQTEEKDKIRSLKLELESAHAALCKVAELRPDQLDDHVKIWARELREASYDMEDILDTFLVRVEGEGGRKPDGNQEHWLKRLVEMVSSLFKKSSERHEMADAIEKIKKNLQDLTERRGRYTVDSIVAKPASSSRAVDPRLAAMYREATQIIGIDKSREDVVSMLSPKGDDKSSKKMKIVSVVGVGGLGKTTLAKAVYDLLKPLFGYGAFVPVGQNPDMKKVFRDILIDLDKKKYTDLRYTKLDVRQLINELRDFLRTKRYFVVIDDLWEAKSWEQIKLALRDNNCGNLILTTTRKLEVANGADEVYRLQPLSYDNSKKLFYTRLFGGEDDCPNNNVDELSKTVLKKCGGVPLAVITMASLLLGKSIEEWSEVCNSPGFYRDKDDKHMENTMHILSLSYYDLPSHLKTCLLYLSVFPEDCLIDKDSLIWKWIAEGFVEKKPGRGLFEVGEEYFHDLVNRSMIQGVNSEVYGILDGCRVHDMVLDLIVSKSLEENFVSVGTLSECRTRRIVQRSRILDLAQHATTSIDLPHVRSFVASGCYIVKWALHPRLQFIRVLALERCDLSYDSYRLDFMENLIHLRYLGLRDTWFYKLPEEIGALKFLHTLDLEETKIKNLPCSIGKVTHLVCLRARGIIMPDGVLGKLTSLEELQIQTHDNDMSRRQFVKDLGNLRELRVLKIHCIGVMDESMQTDLVQSLGNLKNVQHLALETTDYSGVNMNAWDAAMPSRHLRCLLLPYFSFPRLPSCISLRLVSLSRLEIYVENLDEQGLKTLAGLPELRHLTVKTPSAMAMLTDIATGGCFQKLRSLVLPWSTVYITANKDSRPSLTICTPSKDTTAFGARNRGDQGSRRGAHAGVLPNLQDLEFYVDVQWLVRNNGSCEDLGLDKLPSLHRVQVTFWCGGDYADDLEREVAALRHAIEVHPNRPALQIREK